MPCPYGIDIPSIFSHYNKCVCEGFYPQSTQDPDYKEARQAFLVGYDRAVPKLRQADHCIGCGECVGHCPQKLKIPYEMRRVNTYVQALKHGSLDEVNSLEVMMMKAIDKLKVRGTMRVIVNGEDVRSFTREGFLDLYELMQSEPEFLRGAVIADKFVGKAAAAIMLRSGVKSLYAQTLGEGAHEMLYNERSMLVNYDKKVRFIDPMCEEDGGIEMIISKLRESLKTINNF